MNEGFPEKENLIKKEVIESLREHPDDMSELIRYVDEKEKGFKDSKDYLNLNIEVAEIYYEAGLIDAAYESFMDAGDQARQEGNEELASDLYDKAAKILLE